MRQRESVVSLPKWLQSPELGQSEAGNQELLQGLPCGCKSSSTWGPSSDATSSRDLDWEWSSWVLNQCPNGMLVLQAAALFTMACCRPYLQFLKQDRQGQGGKYRNLETEITSLNISC